ncbi:MAG TPA: transglycosylase SLT domain-containing protein [Methylomirabilota bacterium]|nr:transglycosylase SLT domain-containing protein [Methylomirabilota bacterium]
MQSLRVAVRWISLAAFAGVFGFAGMSSRPVDRYIGVAAAGDTEPDRREPTDAAAASITLTGFGVEPGLVVRPTSRADIVIVSTAAPEPDRLARSILAYVAERNPSASMRAFRDFPRVLLDEAARTRLDHCLALAQAQVESDFRPDALGSAGEIGMYQMMPTTAAIFEPALGKFRKPSLRRYERDLGDLADPVLNTRFAMAYLRDILARKPTLREALTEYNGGPRGRQPHYYRTVMATYVEIMERPELGCRVRERRAPTLPSVTLVRR